MALVVVLVVAAVVLRQRARHVRSRRHEAEVGAAVGQVLELAVIGAGAGLNVTLLLHALAPHAPAAVDAAWSDALGRLDAGQPLIDVLDHLGRGLGRHGPVLVDPLRRAVLHGVALTSALETARDDLLEAERRAAETAARRLSVSLLFPLVLCILPAFGLLGIVPLLAGSLTELRR